MIFIWEKIVLLPLSPAPSSNNLKFFVSGVLIVGSGLSPGVGGFFDTTAHFVLDVSFIKLTWNKFKIVCYTITI